MAEDRPDTSSEFPAMFASGHSLADENLADDSEAYGGSGQAPASVLPPEALRDAIIAVLRTIYDPEIPLNIYDLGLIYDIAIDGSAVEVEMTLTAPGCPVAGPLVREVADQVGALESVSRSHVKLVWDPPWTRDRMSEEAQLELGLL